MINALCNYYFCTITEAAKEMLKKDKEIFEKEQFLPVKKKEKRLIL